MELSRVDLFFLMIFSIVHTEAGLNLEKDNVCLKTITYNETLNVTLNRPTSKRYKILCLNENKYCGGETITVPRIITRAKILPYCCEGYKEDAEGTQCIPVCLNGCGNGKCIAPGKCTCEAGFFGSECEKVCDEGRWGENCFLECNCSENEICNKFFGCMCKPGWIGESCKTACPAGYYGFLCEEKCACADNFCDHITGKCIESKELLPTGEEKINGKLNTESPNIATNRKLDEFTKKEDLLTDSNSSTDASLNEINEEATSTVSETDEATTLNPTYFTPHEVEKKVKDSVQAKSSTSVHGNKFEPLQNLGDPVKPPNTPAISDNHENTKRTNILNELATNMGENIFQINELLSSGSNSQATAKENVESSHASNFIPTFTVLSSFAVLIILIGGKWLMIIIRKKFKKIANVEYGCSDEELSILPGEKFIWENNLGNPVYVTDTKDVVPTLQTFKPQAEETRNVACEKKIRLAAE